MHTCILTCYAYMHLCIHACTANCELHPPGPTWQLLSICMATVFQSSVVCAVALSALCCTSYWNSLSGELVHDDIFAIRDNADVRLETPLFALLSNDFWGKAMSDPTSHKSYRPLTVLTFRLNYQLHGLDPWGYHAVNVFLHALCTVLFWLLCGCLVFRNDVVGGESTPLSLQAAAVFAVHPIHTEAVSVM